MLLILFLVAGVVAGLSFGGRLEELGRARVAWAPLAIAGLLAQVVLFSSPVAERIGPLGPPLYVASTAAVLVALLRNVRHPGLPLLAAGAALNLTVIIANGGYMPVSPDALAALGTVVSGPGPVPLDAMGAVYGNTAVAGAGTLLPWLGDLLPIPAPGPLRNVISVGDVLIGLGAAIFIARSMRNGPNRPAEPNRPA
jgi:hypothetical protein